MRRPVLPTSASALFYTKVFFGYLRYTNGVDDFFFFGISSSNRLADDERAVGEFQKRSPQYRDAYVRYALTFLAGHVLGIWATFLDRHRR